MSIDLVLLCVLWCSSLFSLSRSNGCAEFRLLPPRCIPPPFSKQVCKTSQDVQNELRRWLEWVPTTSAAQKPTLAKEPRDALPGPPGLQRLNDRLNDVTSEASRLTLAPSKQS